MKFVIPVWLPESLTIGKLEFTKACECEYETPNIVSKIRGIPVRPWLTQKSTVKGVSCPQCYRWYDPKPL